VALHGRRFLALSFLRGLFVELSAPQLGQDTGFLAGTFEAAQRCIEVLAFSYSDARHRRPAKWLWRNGVWQEKSAG
jgi:hypothetical protein